LICTVHNILKLWGHGFGKVQNIANEAKAIFMRTKYGSNSPIRARSSLYLQVETYNLQLL